MIVKSSCRVLLFGQRLPARKRTWAIPLVAVAVGFPVPTVLAWDGVAAAVGIVRVGVALILADIPLRANPKAATRRLLGAAQKCCRRLLGAAHQCCRVLLFGQRLPARKRTWAIPLVAIAVALPVPTVLARDRVAAAVGIVTVGVALILANIPPH